MIAAISLLVMTAGTGCWLQKIGQEPKAPAVEETEKPGATLGPAPKTELPPEVNFSESGNILNWDAQTESFTDEWTFLYEKPGDPALSVNLVFDGNSVCAVDKGEGPCDQTKLNNGDRVELWGNKVGDQVTVVRLKRLPEL